MPAYEDYPFDEVSTALEERIKEGFTFFQKFTCAGCGKRMTMDVPNRLHTTGACDQCEVITNIVAQGCNYLLVKEYRNF